MRLKLLTFIFVILSSTAFSQSQQGTVVDEYQHHIQGVNIFNKSTKQHDHSDKRGKFTFDNVSPGDTLEFSHIGFESQELILNGNKSIVKIVMNSSLINLEGIVVSPEVNAIKIITDFDIQTTPVNSSQDVLRIVPGLFIGQHAGGGKAEQIFLRGFDIDHGTDITLSVDGLPVNMVSHAHGQGYADMHFVIPETIDKIDFGKGPYYGNKGNFNTAGYVDFLTKVKLDNSSVKLEAGQFNTNRVLGMFNVINSNTHNAYIATEYIATDGPFESSQNFNRINLFGKYTGLLTETDKFGITLSTFTSKWDASGQIPQRAVDSGVITRFGAIDDTEGGNTSRTNLLINYDKYIDRNTSIKSSFYLNKYDFELFSNFTYFLEDPINGDQIKQKEDRVIYGVNSEFERSFSTDNFSGKLQAGISLRNDQSTDNELSRTRNRSETLDVIQSGNINETNVGGYLGTTINYNNWTFNPSIRLDYFDFQYNDALITAYKTQAQTASILSPKFNIIYNQSQELQLYLKAGKGFHSNDTRVVIAEQGQQILPAACGADLGFIWKPTKKMLFNLAYWYLYLEQEFVYVGDAGVVEPSGKTRRQGIDLSFRYQPMSWLFWSLDANYTHARATEENENQDYIPLAPDFTLESGINIIHRSGFYGGINVRHLDNRPANEDNSIVAKGYTITDFNIGRRWNNFNVGIQVQNLFDVEWNETQFATESRLSSELNPVEEIHFTPGNPFYFKAFMEYNF